MDKSKPKNEEFCLLTWFLYLCQWPPSTYSIISTWLYNQLSWKALCDFWKLHSDKRWRGKVAIFSCQSIFWFLIAILGTFRCEIYILPSRIYVRHFETKINNKNEQFNHTKSWMMKTTQRRRIDIQCNDKYERQWNILIIWQCSVD